MSKIVIITFLILSLSLDSQEIVSGKVVYSTTGLPLIGCSVYNTSSNMGTITNENGEFNMSTKIGEKIQFSYIGMIVYTVVVEDFSDINVEMKFAIKKLRDVYIRPENLAKKSILYNPKADEKKTVKKYGRQRHYSEYMNVGTLISSPITFLAAALNKKYQRKTQAIKDLNEMEYCEKKYSIEFISLITNEEDETTLKDIRAHCYFPRDLIIQSSYYELGIHIKNCYLDFLKNGKPYIKADSSLYENLNK